MNLGKLQEMVRDWEAWHAAVHAVAELDLTWRLNNNNNKTYFLTHDASSTLHSLGLSLTSVITSLSPSWSSPQTFSVEISHGSLFSSVSISPHTHWVSRAIQVSEIEPLSLRSIHPAQLRLEYLTAHFTFPLGCLISQMQHVHRGTSDVCCCFSAYKSCLTVCNPMDCSMPSLLVPHYLPEFAQVHVCWTQWCYPTISSSATLFSHCLQSFPSSGSFPMSQLFASGGESIGASALVTVLSMNIQGWFPLGFDWFDLAVQGTLWSLPPHQANSTYSPSYSRQTSHNCPDSSLSFKLIQNLSGTPVDFTFKINAESEHLTASTAATWVGDTHKFSPGLLLQ